ncbi:hypothetical protein C7M84_017481 [Penaeus vannamei]|uniref:Reverse transcriptase RNase H-like domain-containing protein n=1 Tax=Penaeus vannamei TaxID=6689 RepID=A0A3R7NRA4_PENVA|nr:hypothetical protein C7M84_017481 [Penaeus vannamei]
MLAASWAMGKCRLYLAGLQHFTLHTDHRPLIPILNHYTLDAIENPRLQRLRVKMAPYVFTAVWRAGKTLCVPDALSRAPVSHPTFDDEEECTMTAAHVRSLVSTNATSTDGQATAPILDDDRTLQELRAVCGSLSITPSATPFFLANPESARTVSIPSEFRSVTDWTSRLNRHHRARPFQQRAKPPPPHMHLPRTENLFQPEMMTWVMVVMTAVSQTSLRVVRPMYHHPSHPLSPLTLPAPRSTVQLLSMIAPKPLQVQQTSPEQQAPAAHQLSPVPPVATTSGSPHAPITAPVMGKPMIPSPPQLQSDVTYQLFRQWRRKFEDYSVLMGLHSLPPATQHIYLRTCVSLEVQRLLHYTLAIPPDSSMPVVQVLDALQQYFRNSQNEALRRRELLSCKQTPGEPFSAFYARMKDLADEVELCTGDRTTCAATQLKMILLMGVREEELVQRLVSLDSQASLDDFPTQHPLFIQEEPTPPEDDSYDQAHASTLSVSTVDQGLPASSKDSECTTCHKQGHFAKCCKSTRKTSTNQPHRARRVSTGRTPKPVNVTLAYGSKSSQLLMLPDTGADITVIGPKHLDSLGIPRCSLSPPPATDVLTADGSSMTPALARSSKAIVHVHEGIQTPLLSYGHCVDLAIVSTDFPKPILSVTHVNRCAQQMPASAMFPTAARTYFLQHFSDILVSKTDLQTTPLKMSGPPMRIHLQPGATPFAIHMPRPIPFAYRTFKEELDSLVQ